MPRLPVIAPDQTQGRIKEIFQGPLKGKHLNIFKSMANSAAVLEAYLGLAGAVGKTSLSPAQREVVQLAVGQANNCEYCVAAHTKIGQGSGLTEDQCVGARRGSIPDDPSLDAVAKFALAIHEKHGFVSDDDIASFKAAGFSDAQVAEMVAVYSLAIFTNYFNHVNETECDFPMPVAV